LKALRAMFEYYYADEDDAPMTFILIGSFISTPFPGNGYSTTYKAHWDALANVLSQFPRLTANCSFVFIPGPNDPWTTPPGCLPRRGIPEAFTNRVRRICKDVRFVSNPTRLGYFTQEICVFRNDIADSLIRNRIMVKDVPTKFQDPMLDEATLAARDVFPPSPPPIPYPLYLQHTLIRSQLVKTILDQSHLTPFPLQVAPTYWSFDHTLRLYPLPTALVICDISGWGPFKVTYEGCSVINIGSMLRVDKGDGRGRYTAAWWEWDCGTREGQEVMVNVTEKPDQQHESEDGNVTREKRERKKRNVEKGLKIGGIAGSVTRAFKAAGMNGVGARIDGVNGGDTPIEDVHMPIEDRPEEGLHSPMEDVRMKAQIEDTRIEDQMEEVAFGDEI